MKLTLKPVTVAVVIASAQLSGMAFAQTTESPTAHSEPVAANATPANPSPTDWIIYDDTTYTPVADGISRHLDAARKAFDVKDNKKAAAEMRTVADDLKTQAARAAKADKTLSKSELSTMQDTSRHLDAVAKKISAVAAGIESGTIKTKTDLDKAIDKAARADMERRWLVTDVTAWYSQTEKPQQHFGSAVESYAKKDYKTAATEIRKATGYMRLEADRTTGAGKQALDGSVAELDKLATSIEKGTGEKEKVMDKAFAHANHALALAHRTEAAESWVHKEYEKAGYELKAAAYDLESAAGWAGQETKAGTSAVVADTRALGGKLSSGAAWTRDEVGKGFESLGNALNELAHKIGAKQQATPVKLGS